MGLRRTGIHSEPCAACHGLSGVIVVAAILVVAVLVVVAVVQEVVLLNVVLQALRCGAHAFRHVNHLSIPSPHSS